MFRILAIALIGIAGRAEIVDRTVVTVGRQVITELELEEEIRVTAFFNQTPDTEDIAKRREAAGRLVQQLFVAREMRLSHYPPPGETDVEKALDQVREVYANQNEFQGALARYGLNEDILRKHLAQQIATLHFVEYRFRPELGISEADLQSHYKDRIATWAADHPGAPAPSFDASRDSIRSALISERTDEALDNWLKETRKQIRITYLERDLENPEAANGQ